MADAAAVLSGLGACALSVYFGWNALHAGTLADQATLTATALASIGGGATLLVRGFRRLFTDQDPQAQTQHGATAGGAVPLAALSVDPPYGLAPERLRGRDAILAQLYAAVPAGRPVNALGAKAEDGSGGAGVRTHAPSILFGMGGVGKTAIALTVAQRAKSSGLQVFWLNCRNQTVFHSGVLEVVNRLLLHRPPSARPAQPGAQVDLMWQLLEECDFPWLLILDNADDERTLGGPQAGNGWVRTSARGMVLVTTRIGTPEMWGAGARMLRVGTLDPAAAGAMLRDLTQPVGPSVGTVAEAESLGRRLGCLPLALRAAGRFLAAPVVGSPQAHPRTFAAYHEAVDREFSVIDAVEELPGPSQEARDARTRVRATWELSLQLLADRGMPDARTLLNLMSCYAAEPIPWVLLDGTGLREGRGLARWANELLHPRRRDSVLGSLRDLGLVDTDESASHPLLRWADENWTGSTMVVVHPLVREAIHDGLSRDRARHRRLWTVAALLVLHARQVVGAPASLRGWLRWHMLAPHIEGVIRSVPASLTRRFRSTLRRLIRLAVELTWLLIKQDEYATALDLISAVRVQSERNFSRRARVAVAVRHTRGHALWVAGRRDEADAELSTTYVPGERLMRRTLSEHDFLMVYRSMHGLSQGPMTDDTMDMIRRALRLRQRLFGQATAFTLALHMSVAAGHFGRAEYAEASRNLREILRLRAKRLGQDDSATLNTREWLGASLAAAGDLAGATEQARAILESYLRQESLIVAIAMPPVQRPSVGDRPENPAIQSARRWLGELLERQGDLTGAEGEYRRVVANAQKTFGPDDPTVIDTRDKLGRLLTSVSSTTASSTTSRRADHEDIVRRLEQIYSGRVEHLGPDDPDTLRAAYMLSVMLDGAQRYGEARTLKLDTLERLRRVLGPEHPDTVRSEQDDSLRVTLVGPPAPGTHPPTTGPFDIGDHADVEDLLDFGSLALPAVAGVELRVQAEDSGLIQQLVLVHEESALQIGLFAAPPDRSIWPEILREIADQLRSDGSAPAEQDGPYGPELVCRVMNADGGTELRFAGVDGPGWMLRFVYQGEAATDPQQAAVFDDVTRALVVDRGGDLLPVRTPLQMYLPQEIRDQQNLAAAAAG